MYWGAVHCALTDLANVLRAFDLMIRAYHYWLEDLYTARDFLDLIFRRRSHEHLSPLLHALIWFSEMKCSDERDLLYSLVSLDPTFGIIPDYSLSVAEVSIQFARHLAQSGYLAFVLQACRFNSREDCALPSWVPDIRRCLSPAGILPKSHELNTKVSSNNILTFTPYLYGCLESADRETSPLKITIRWLNCSNPLENQIHVSMSANWLIDCIRCTNANGGVEITNSFTLLEHHPLSMNYEPEDLCCGLSSDIDDYNNVIFLIRATSRSYEEFEIIGALLRKAKQELAKCPRGFVRTTVNII